MTVALLAIVVTFAAVVGLDLWLYLSGRQTISGVIREGASAWWMVALLVAFALGLLAGHWFWCGT